MEKVFEIEGLAEIKINSKKLTAIPEKYKKIVDAEAQLRKVLLANCKNMEDIIEKENALHDAVQNLTKDNIVIRFL